MHPSNLKAVLGVGALAGAMFLTGMGAPTLPGAFAQDATPDVPAAAPGDASATGGVQDERMQAMTERYDAFLGKMAAELGATNDEVDAAIRTSLKGMIDDAVTAGNLAANDATAIKARIDEAEIPIFGIAGHGIGGPDGRGETIGGGEHRGRDDRGHSDDERNDADSDEVQAETQSTSGSFIDLQAPMI